MFSKDISLHSQIMCLPKQGHRKNWLTHAIVISVLDMKLNLDWSSKKWEVTWIIFISKQYNTYVVIGDPIKRTSNVSSHAKLRSVSRLEKQAKLFQHFLFSTFKAKSWWRIFKAHALVVLHFMHPSRRLKYDKHLLVTFYQYSCTKKLQHK